MSYRLSIAERIALTSGFRTSSDSRVLTALTSFAHFETGVGAHPSVEKLQSRVPDLGKRTIERGLARLEKDGWIQGTHYHRRPTNYRICVERLATGPSMAKVVDPDPGFVRHIGGQHEEFLSATLSCLSATLSGLTAKVADHPVLDPNLDPSAPALRAGLDPADVQTRTPKGESPEAPDAFPRSSTRHPDLRADGGDSSRPDPHATRGDLVQRPDGIREAAPPGARVSLRAGSDSPSDRRAQPPYQQTFGPIDVSPSPRPSPQWGSIADAFRKGLERKSG